MSKKDFFAFDRASVRSKDANGHLLVEITNISKANVCPYYGHEIPDSDKLGLKPDQVYMLLRDPEELAKAASSFNEKPILLRHKPVSADDHPREITVGTLGSNAVFESPYLKNSMTIWDQEAIDLIESEEQKELSPGYRYVADMTPGTFQGEDYDGVMRDIEGNHLALVVEGRTGSDVVVGDSALEKNTMSKLTLMGATAKGALTIYLRPKLAQDAKIDLTGLVKGVTAKAWKDSKKKIATDLAAATKGKLAKDADLSDLTALLDSLDGGAAEMSEAEKEDGEAPGLDDEEENKPDGEEGEDEHSEGDEEELWRGLHVLIGKMLGKEGGAEDGEECGAMDDPPEFEGKPEKGEKPMNKAAMDAALAKVAQDTERKTVERINAIHEAKALVKPHVGELRQAFDSAESVFKYALDKAKVDLKGVHPSAYRAMVKMLPNPGDKQSNPSRTMRNENGVTTAMDSADFADFEKRFPGVAEISVM